MFYHMSFLSYFIKYFNLESKNSLALDCIKNIDNKKYLLEDPVFLTTMYKFCYFFASFVICDCQQSLI